MNLKKILMWCGLAVGCVALLSGCAGMMDSLATDVQPQEINTGVRLPSDTATQWKALLSESLKKDCEGEYGKFFKAAPATGWSANSIDLSFPYRLQLSEEERTQIVGTIEFVQSPTPYQQNVYTYVIFPDYVYVSCRKANYAPKVVKIPFSLIYDRQKFGALEFRINRYAQPQDSSSEMELKALQELCSGLASRLSLGNEAASDENLKAVFGNVYTANTGFFLKYLGDRLTAYETAQSEIKAKAQQEKEAAKQKEIQEFLSWDDTSAKATAEAMKGKTVVFKSLYLGMPMGDAYHLLCKEIDSIYDLDNASQMGVNGFLAFPQKDLRMPFTRFANLLMTTACQVPYEPKNTDSLFAVVLAMDGVSAIIEGNPQGEVVGIYLSSKVVDKLFGATGMDGSKFADQFMKSYGIPKMDTAGTWNNPAWTFTSKDGAKLTIDSEKVLMLEKVAGQADLKKAFN